MNPTEDFPPTARIRKTAEYDFVKLEGSRAYGQWLMVSYVTRRRASAAETSRLGIAVTKKVAARAVDRNRFKRVIRDAFRRCRHAMIRPVDVVVVARRDVVAASAATLRAEFLSLLRQEKLLGTDR